ncbi:Crp/Fnr family transcriptional regulator [Mucilaginibacter aquatilis]|nr:Crp/Fnr family transcriptional regulator [Mucilaginibacter aquatilis]
MSVAFFIAYLNNLITLPAPLAGKLEQACHEEIYQPHQVIHAAGQPETRLWFLSQGFCRAYYFDHTGKEHTLAFYDAGDLIFSYEGYWQESTDRYLEALDRSVLISLRYTDLHSMLQDYPQAIKLKDIFVRRHEHLERFRKRLMTWSAEERYLQTRKLQPDLFRKTSVRLIATYLNMTRENLSRLMARDL